jgi:tRNA (guanine9-N1)-methyltransferase
MRKAQAFEDSKDERRKRRKEKRHDRKDRKREERAALVAQGVDPASLIPQKQPSTLVPVGLIIDCDFEQYMMDKERISLGSQITRSYSDNKAARYRAHLWVSSWTGKLRDRFRNVLNDQQKNWKGIGFCEGDYLECASQLRQNLKNRGGEMIEPLQRSLENKTPWVRDEKETIPLPKPLPELKEDFKDIVYLTSDSPYTLDRIEPHTMYIIGGLVDKNREKGLCYRQAVERGIRTAKLPIGEFMVMQSRQVLATNHVVEIMVKWLEFEDWGKAFVSVIPKRKGGRLRGEEEEDDDGNGEDGEAAEAGEEKEIQEQPKGEPQETKQEEVKT